MDDLLEIAERLRHRPGVEAVAISQNCIPYGDGSNGIEAFVDTVPVYAMLRLTQPDYMRLFRIRGVAVQGADGRTVYTTSSDSLAAVLGPGTMVLSRNAAADCDALGRPDATELLGRRLSLWKPGTDNSLRVAGVAEPMRWSHFTTTDQWGGPFLATDFPREVMVEYENPAYLQLSVRVTPEADHGFAETLMAEADRLYRVGNVYVLDVLSFDQLQHIEELEDVNEVKTQLCILAAEHLPGRGRHLLVPHAAPPSGGGSPHGDGQHAVGHLRATDYRRAFAADAGCCACRPCGAEPRRGGAGGRRPIALRRAALRARPGALVAADGADDCRGRMLSRPPCHAGSRFVLALVLSWLLMALMIVVGVCYPARRAMQVQPAEALHDE